MGTANSATTWYDPPADLALELCEAHVWRVSMDVTPSRVEALQRHLSSDEQARADRFHFARDRRRFIVARATLRSILGRYLRREPQQIRFSYTEHNKPVLADASSIHFNVSHSDEVALYAVSREGEVGVDVERIRTDFEPKPIADLVFSADENALLQSAPDIDRHRVFFACWTGKEAYVKALGYGLLCPLKEFSVSPEGGPVKLLSPTGHIQSEASLSVHRVDAGEGYAAALAWEGRQDHLRFWQRAA